MSSDAGVHELIDRRVSLALGTPWETGGVGVVDDNSYMAPRLDPETKSYVTMLWPSSQDLDVANGLGAVTAIGKINGWEISRDGSLDDVLAYVAERTPKLLAKRRSALQRLFGS